MPPGCACVLAAYVSCLFVLSSCLCLLVACVLLVRTGCLCLLAACLYCRLLLYGAPVPDWLPVFIGCLFLLAAYIYCCLRSWAASVYWVPVFYWLHVFICCVFTGCLTQAVLNGCLLLLAACVYWLPVLTASICCLCSLVACNALVDSDWVQSIAARALCRDDGNVFQASGEKSKAVQ